MMTCRTDRRRLPAKLRRRARAGCVLHCAPVTDRAPGGVKVLYLAGKGRSGGTLLAGLLGQLPGFFNVGELNRLWDFGLVHDYPCGCGRPIQECPVWSAVVADADAQRAARGLSPLRSSGIDRAQASAVRWPRLLQLLAARPADHLRNEQLDAYVDAVATVYRSIVTVTGARVVVDSSRLPIEPVALGLVPGVDARIVQLVRDPRAVVYSWKRGKAITDRDTGEHQPKYSAAFSTTSWTARNAVVELLRRRCPVQVAQYDELARDPEKVLRSLAEFAGEPAGDLAFLTADAATMEPTHSVAGNPARLDSGQVSIRPDDEWREKLGRRDRIVGTALALPLLRRYGLPISS
jgi:Sulfotransferase family